MTVTPAQLRMQAQIATLARWAAEPDRTAAMKPAHDGFLARFERQVDPDGTLSPEERRTRAETARRALMRKNTTKNQAPRKADADRAA